jgi:hypothetical protein
MPNKPGKNETGGAPGETTPVRHHDPMASDQSHAIREYNAKQTQTLSQGTKSGADTTGAVGLAENDALGG